MQVQQAALAALMEGDLERKLALVAAIAADESGLAEFIPVGKVDVPGRPQRPELVPVSRLAHRSVHTLAGRAALLHAITHIEFNAINLALDAVCRFAGMPADYYQDWLRVAREEAEHFVLLRTHLRSLGHDYGDFPAHNGLWDMAVRTDHDVLARMALVPRVMEARGLDATPGIQQKLALVGDHAACAVLDVILRDEIGHVRIGNRWFHWCCQQRGLDPIPTFIGLLREYDATLARGALNYPARLEAGFQEDELALLQSLQI